MFENKDVISVIFKLINFFILIFLIKILFKKYGLPEIKNKLFEKLSFFKNLKEKYKSLVEQNLIAKKEIRDQDNLFDLLSKKIKKWTTARKLQEEEIKSELEEVSANHKKRIDAQSENIYQKKMINKVLPQVIEGTSKQLKEKFSQEKESKKFLKDIISYMEKSSDE